MHAPGMAAGGGCPARVPRQPVPRGPAGYSRAAYGTRCPGGQRLRGGL